MLFCLIENAREQALRLIESSVARRRIRCSRRGSHGKIKEGSLRHLLMELAAIFANAQVRIEIMLFLGRNFSQDGEAAQHLHSLPIRLATVEQGNPAFSREGFPRHHTS
jgi:hypothetical protein